MEREGKGRKGIGIQGRRGEREGGEGTGGRGRDGNGGRPPIFYCAPSSSFLEICLGYVFSVPHRRYIFDKCVARFVSKSSQSLRLRLNRVGALSVDGRCLSVRHSVSCLTLSRERKGVAR